MSYQKVAAEIIRTEIASLNDTILTYIKCVALLTQIDSLKKKPDGIETLKKDLQQYLPSYQQTFTIVGASAEVFLGSLKIALPEQIESEKDANKIAKALINLIGSQQFFKLNELRANASAHHAKFAQALEAIFEMLSKSQEIDLTDYLRGPKPVHSTAIASTQRLMRYKLLGDALKKALPTDLHNHYLFQLADLLDVLGSRAAEIANEKEKINAKASTSSQTHVQTRELLEKITVLITTCRKQPQVLTPEQHSELERLEKMKTETQNSLNRLAKESKESVEAKKLMQSTQTVLSAIKEIQVTAQSLLTNIYVALEETAPPFKRELSLHKPYTVTIEQKPASIEDVRSGRSKSFNRTFSNVIKAAKNAVSSIKDQLPSPRSSSPSKRAPATNADSEIAVLNAEASSSAPTAIAPAHASSSTAVVPSNLPRQGSVRARVAEIEKREQELREQEQALLDGTNSLWRKTKCFSAALSNTKPAEAAPSAPISAATNVAPSFNLMAKGRSQSMGATEKNKIDRNTPTLSPRPPGY